MKYKVKQSDILMLAICLFVFSLCTHGFFRAFFSFKVVTDLCGVLMVGCILFINKVRVRLKEELPLLFWLVCVFFLGCVLVAVINSYSFRHSLLGLRNYVLYVLLGVSLSELRNVKSFETLMTWMMRIGTVVCLYAIVQFLLYDHLPLMLVRYEGSGVEGVFTHGTHYIFRVNGLLENTIVFGGFATIITTMLCARMLVFKLNWIDAVSICITAGAVALTFGRIAIAGAVACCLLLFFLAGRVKWKTKLLILVAVILLAVLFLFIFRNTVLVQRLIGAAGMNSVSDDLHFTMIESALDVIGKNWFFGVGLGTQGYNRGPVDTVIADGGWFSIALELGVPMTIVLAACMVTVIVHGLYCLKNNDTPMCRWVNSVSVCLSVYFIAASFLNSSFAAVSNYGFYWCLVGCCIGINRLERIKHIPAFVAPANGEKLLSVVIVSYNNRDVLVDCLASVQAQNDIGTALEVIVVEQSPTDDIYNFLIENYPDVTTIRAENRGFGAGNNRGVEAATGKYLLLLNPDTVILNPSFRFAVEKFESDEKLGLFGVKLLDAAHAPSDSFENVVPFGFLRKVRYKVCRVLDVYLPWCMYIQGADIFVRADVFRAVGGFDEEIFMYCEEPDLCTRVKNAGYRRGYYPDYEIVHLQGACTPDKIESKYTRQLEAYKHVAARHGWNFRRHIAAERRLQSFKRLVYKMLRRQGSEGDVLAEAQIGVIDSFLKAGM